MPASYLLYLFAPICNRIDVCFYRRTLQEPRLRRARMDRWPSLIPFVTLQNYYWKPWNFDQLFTFECVKRPRIRVKLRGGNGSTFPYSSFSVPRIRPHSFFDDPRLILGTKEKCIKSVTVYRPLTICKHPPCWFHIWLCIVAQLCIKHNFHPSPLVRFCMIVCVYWYAFIKCVAAFYGSDCTHGHG